MRKTVFLLLLVTLQFFCEAQKQQNEVTLKIQYSPNTKYTSTMETTSLSELKYSGSEEVLARLAKKNVPNPTISENKSTVEMIYKTGNLSQGIIPMTLEFTKSTGLVGKNELPEDMIIYGHTSPSSLPTLDSVTGSGLDEEVKKIILDVSKTIFKQIDLPERKIKIGQTVSVETPLSLPVANLMVIEMIITTDYKLLSIKNGIADFDIKQKYAVKTNSSQYIFDATGTGKGKMLFDIANNFFFHNETETEMLMNIKVDPLIMDLKSKTNIVQTTVITKN